MQAAGRQYGWQGVSRGVSTGSLLLNCDMNLHMCGIHCLEIRLQCLLSASPNHRLHCLQARALDRENRLMPRRPRGTGTQGARARAKCRSLATAC